MSDISATIKGLREVGGFCKAEPFGLIEIYGKDDTRFLQSQTTNDVAQLEHGKHQETCLLDRKAKVQAYFSLYRRHESYRVIVEKTQIRTILDHLEHHRIADKVEFLDLSNTGKFFVLQGPKCRQVIKLGLKTGADSVVFKNELSDQRMWGIAVHFFQKSITGEEGYFLWVTKSDEDAFFRNFSATCSELGLVKLDDEALNVARIEAGMPKFGIDFDSENFLPETGIDQSTVSYTKGCFIGQEVLARVKSQGAPTRGLIGLKFAPDQHQSFDNNAHLMLGAEEVAVLKSHAYSPTLQCTISLASAKRDYRAPDKVLDATINGTHTKATVCTLPFYHADPPQVVARQLYAEALKLYADEKDDMVESPAVERLRHALDLDPVFEDAYEALGVILSKRDRLDEAIMLMKQLAALNPDSVMAHTNLSVFYVDQGLKDEAEEEKAISMSIRMRLAAQLATSQKKEEDKKAQELEEASGRMEMFKQVLEIDNEDLLANYGVGSCYVVLGEFEDAIPFLQKAIEVKPAYTQAYSSLAQAFEGCGQVQSAVDAYQKGIEVASKRGDMTPLADMQKRLAALKSTQRAVSKSE
jgi:folate-binding protein YgfZ